MRPATRQRLHLTSGTELTFITAGEAAKPAVLLLHGSPSSAHMFREVIPELSQAAYVIAPDLPGFGESDVLPSPSFPALGHAISELLDRLSIGPRYIYLHDYGAPVGFHIAMRAPERVLGLIIQNANAHRTGLGPQWDATQAYWSQPTPENQAAATAHLTFEGTRGTYVSGAPPDVVARMSPEVWEEDWRVMNLPGRMDTQRALIRDYGKYVERFDAIADYLARRQPPALMVWGRHDPFFELAEVVSWMQALPRMEAHVLDAGHKLLETHAAAAVSLMLDFVTRTAPFPDRDRTSRDAL
jgi:pimeloyl-ACP methyl ester carboxylesterase